MLSSSEKPLVGEARYVTTLTTAAKETIFAFELVNYVLRLKAKQEKDKVLSSCTVLTTKLSRGFCGSWCIDSLLNWSIT